MKKPVVGVTRPLTAEGIGNLWQARQFFTYSGLGRQANPAIHATLIEPQHVAAADDPTSPRSTGVQPQAGFESVTLLLEGDLEVRTSLPEGQPPVVLGAGDVLWNGMGRGVLTETLAGPQLTREGGTVSAVTLWVNLPAAYKLSDPHRQYLPAAQIPSFVLPESAGTLRVIAGQWHNDLGPAETVGPLQLWDVRVKAGHTVTLPLPQKWYAQLLMLTGKITIDFWPDEIGSPQLVLLDAYGDGTTFTVKEDTHLILLCCEPLDEPIVGRGDLVFGDEPHLQDAEARLKDGGFGKL